MFVRKAINGAQITDYYLQRRSIKYKKRRQCKGLREVGYCCDILYATNNKLSYTPQNHFQTMGENRQVENNKKHNIFTLCSIR